jgi:hypothetical protein
VSRSPEAEGFLEVERRFAAHLREPGAHPAPADVDAGRMAVYRELLYGNVEALMAGSFPVLRETLGDADWHALLREYFARHRAATPYFPQMPRELLRYLEDERGARAEDPPWLTELAHYEWVEAALALDPREPVAPGVDPQGDLLAGVPVLSPLAWPVSYRFPVHRIGVDFRPVEPPPAPTHLVVYRDREDTVRFLEVNPVTARLLEVLALEPAPTGRAAIAQIATELGHPDPGRVLEAGQATLEALRARGVVLGSCPPPP